VRQYLTTCPKRLNFHPNGNHLCQCPSIIASKYHLFLLLYPNPLHGIGDGGQVCEHDPVLLGHDLAFGLLDLGLGIGIHEPFLGLDEIVLRPSLFNLKSLSESTRHSSASYPWRSSSALSASSRWWPWQAWRRNPSLPLAFPPAEFMWKGFWREFMLHWREGPWSSREVKGGRTHCPSRRIGVPNLGNGWVGLHELVHLGRPAGACMTSPPIRTNRFG
jgi:hypothetical protein